MYARFRDLLKASLFLGNLCYCVAQEFSNWPTIPQLYVDGEFTGGADIMIESFQSGELKKSLEEAGCKFVASE